MYEQKQREYQQVKTQVAYTYDPLRFALGKPCKHLHIWPGTTSSLRYRYKEKSGNFTTSSCVACGSPKNEAWLARFIDQEKTGVPAGKILGKPCKNGHTWNGTRYTLRRSKSGTCTLCEREKRQAVLSDPVLREKHLACRRKYYKNNPEKRKALYIKQRDKGIIREYIKREDVREKRRAYATVRRRRQGISPRKNLTPVQKYLRDWHKHRPLTVSELVKLEQINYWKNNPKEKQAYLKHKAKLKHRWLQLTSAEYRLYQRNKSKMRKARLRQNTTEQVHTKTLTERFAKFKNACAYCGATEVDLHIEHVVPIARNGPHKAKNLVPSCPSCNFSKRDHPVESWYRAQPFYSATRWLKILQLSEVYAKTGN